MGPAARRKLVCVGVLLSVVTILRVATADERARLSAALEDRRVSSSPEALVTLGEEANGFAEAEVRIAAWLFVAEGLTERASRPAQGASYALRAIAEPTIGAVDRGRAVAVLTTARVAAGDRAGAIALAERESEVAPGLARRLRAERRAAVVLSMSRWALASMATLGLVAAANDARRGRDALVGLLRRFFDAPVLVVAALVASVAPVLAFAFDPTVEVGPFLRLALGILLVHATLATVRRFLRPLAAAALALGGVAFVASWAYLGSARPLPAWAAP